MKISIIILISILVLACGDGMPLQDGVECTELGIPVTHNGHTPDLEEIDKLYLGVCACVGIPPFRYIDEITIVINPRFDSEIGTILGLYIPKTKQIIVEEDLYALEHELGHFFVHEIFGGYINIEMHSPEDYAIECHRKERHDN